MNYKLVLAGLGCVLVFVVILIQNHSDLADLLVLPLIWFSLGQLLHYREHQLLNKNLGRLQESLGQLNLALMDNMTLNEKSKQTIRDIFAPTQKEEHDVQSTRSPVG